MVELYTSSGRATKCRFTKNAAPLAAKRATFGDVRRLRLVTLVTPAGNCMDVAHDPASASAAQSLRGANEGNYGFNPAAASAIPVLA